MALRDGFDYGQAQATAPFAGIGSAVEARKCAGTVGGRDPRSLIGHFEHRLAAADCATHAHLHRRIFGRVAHRIVEQIAHQDPQRLGVRPHGHRPGRLEFDADPPLLRQRLHVAHGLARDRAQRRGGRVHR